MKRINKEELPEILTEDILTILVEMAMEFPQSKQWHEIFDELDRRNQLMLVLDRVHEREKAIEQAKENAKSEEQKQKEKQEWEEFVKNADPHEFYGNMGEPRAVYDYKDKYGVWPYGLDDSIAPLTLPAKLSQEQISKIANLYLHYRKTVQWEEVYAALKKNEIDFSIIFNRVLDINKGLFPMDITVQEFKEKYGVLPPGYNENKD